MIIHRNKSYVIVVSLLKCLIILYSPFFLWWCKMIKCLCDGIKWSNESALWPSVRLLLTFWPYIRRRIAWFRRSWIMEPGWLEVSCRRCWRLEILARDLIILLRMHANWNLRIVYFWDFLFHTFGPKVTETVEKETKGKWLLQVGDTSGSIFQSQPARSSSLRWHNVQLPQKKILCI